MTLLIKGMEMPKSCSKCWFVEFTMREDKPCYQCYLTRETTSEQDFERRGIRNCPLDPVPTPHGRLIDADALCEGRVNNDNVVICAKCAPTVIEAEVNE